MRFAARLFRPSVRPVAAAILAALLVTLAAARPASAQNDPRARAAVARAVGFLKQTFSAAGRGHDSLAAYAMLQAGEPVSGPEIQQALANVRGRFESGRYAINDHYGTYIAAVDLMFLEALDPVSLRNEIEAIARFLVETQHSGGYWEYPRQDRGGDTSQTQYALLGLWAAHRAGIEIPAKTWDAAAGFLLATQQSDGGSAYTPRDTMTRGWQTTSSYTMTTATVGSFHLVRRMLHPSVADTRERPRAEPERRFGVLRRLDPNTPEGEPTPAAGDGRPQVTTADLANGIRRGMGWFTPRYRIAPVDRQLYYLYGLERMCALGDFDTIAGNDWYAHGVEYLVNSQEENGQWARSEPGATAFGVLFIMRATSKLLGRGLPPPQAIGAGLLKGGRGLPSDLSQALLSDGKVETRKLDDPIEQLLAQLERQDAPQAVESVQQAIIEKVQLGNREELIGQKNRLVTLARHPDAEVRRTALWALGRTDDLSLVKLMVQALKDPDVGVRIEAHNALCALSRRPAGFDGLPDDPLEGLSEDATDQEKQAAIDRWSRAVHERWYAWYLSVRPYDERDDLQEPQPRRGR